MKKRIYLSIAICMLIVSTSIAQNKSYEVVYAADNNGKAISGSLEKLNESISNGNPIRVGWVLRFKNPITNNEEEMWHWTDANFITTLSGHVFAQVQPIFQQGPGFGDVPIVNLVTNKPDSWVAIVGTTGQLKQKFIYDEATLEMMKQSFPDEETMKKELKKMEEMKVETKWAIMQ